MQIAPRSVPAWLRFVIYKSYPSDWPKSSSARFSPCHLGGTSSCMGHPWSRPPALLATFETWPIWATINIYRKCFPLRSKQQGHLFSPGINIQTTHCPSIFRWKIPSFTSTSLASFKARSVSTACWGVGASAWMTPGHQGIWWWSMIISNQC